MQYKVLQFNQVLYEWVYFIDEGLLTLLA